MSVEATPEERFTKVLLAVLAHPDDESFGLGGTLAFYARRGVQVHLVCATRGEAGEMDDDCLDGFSSIAERRVYELQCAAQHLAIAGVHFLDYRDSGMLGSEDNNHPRALVRAPVADVAQKVAEIIRRLRPQVVITFDPIGGYRHPDHIAIHQATRQAFLLSGDPAWVVEGLPPYRPQKLYFHTMSRRFLKLAVRILPLIGKDPQRFGRNGDIDLVAIASVDFPTHAVIDYRSVYTQKRMASLCHASQGGQQMAGGLIGWLMRLFGSHETFMRCFPPPVDEEVEHDLFAGVGAVH